MLFSGLLRFLGLVNEQNGNAVADRIDATAAGAVERIFVRRQSQRLPALGNGADEDVQELLNDHLTVL